MDGTLGKKTENVGGKTSLSSDRLRQGVWLGKKDLNIYCITDSVLTAVVGTLQTDIIFLNLFIFKNELYCFRAGLPSQLY